MKMDRVTRAMNLAPEHALTMTTRPNMTIVTTCPMLQNNTESNGMNAEGQSKNRSHVRHGPTPAYHVAYMLEMVTQ